MYQLLSSFHVGKGIHVEMLDAQRHRSLINREMAKITNYYKAKKLEVASSHLIVQVIKNLNLSLLRDDYSTIDASKERCAEMCQKLGLVHQYNSNPQEFPGMFYNKFIREFVIGNDLHEPNLRHFKFNWRRINSVRVCCHPYSDIDMNLPNGKYPSNKSGYSVIDINIPALMLQYKYWAKSRLAKDETKVNIRPELFVGSVVIPNMLVSHMNVCFVNRFMDVSRGVMVSVMKRVHQIGTNDITRNIDALVETQLKIYNQYKPGEHDFYKITTTIMGNNFLSQVKPPPHVPNINMRIFILLACTPYVKFLFDFIKTRGGNIERATKDKIVRSVRLAKHSDFGAFGLIEKDVKDMTR